MRGWQESLRTVALAGFAAAMLVAPGPVRAQTPDLAGIWEVDGFTHAYGAFRFFVDVERQGSEWVATKLNSSRYVPRGNTHFIGTVSDDALSARVQVALPGFAAAEWQQHRFSLERDSGGKVIRIHLATGESHVEGADGERTINDSWIYRRWPSGQFRLLGPKIVDWGYRSARSIRQSDLRHVNDNLKLWRDSLDEASTRLDRAITDFNSKHQAVLDRQGERQKARRDALEALRGVGRDEPVDTTEMPSRLRNLYRMVESEKASIKRAEQIILDHQSGAAPQSSATIATLFRGIDSSRANITRLEGVIARVRRELGLGPEPDREDAQRTTSRDAERRYQQISDRYYQARREESRAETEMILARGQVNLAQENIDELEVKKLDLEAQIKGLEDEGHLVSIEGFVDGDLENAVYQAVPSGLDRELRTLREKMNVLRESLQKARDQQKRFRDLFKVKFDEGTELRDEVAELIWENAKTMAAANLVTKSTEFGVAFATGGPAGLAIEMVATPVFQHALYEDGVIFSNFDESEMRANFRNAQAAETAGEPDPSAACRDLNMEIDEQIKQAVYGVPAVRADAAPNTENVEGGPLGNPNQRIGTNWQHQSLVFMSEVEKKLIGDVAGKMNILQTSYLEAQQKLVDRVISRAALAGQHQALAELLELDAKIAARTVAHAERAAALAQRTQLINRLVAESPELAARLAGHSDNIGILMRQLRSAQQLGSTEVAERLITRIAAEQSATVSALRQSASHINWTSVLAHQSDMAARLTREMTKMARFEKALESSGWRNGMKGNVAAIGLSVAFSLMHNEIQESLQAEEQALWHRIFAAEIEQSLRLKAWQRSTCIYWAFYDQYFALRRHYSKLYSAYDPETGFEVKKDGPVRDHQSLDLRLVYDPLKVHRLEVRVGETACPESARNGCRIPAGGLSSETGPYLPVDIVLHPRE